MGWILRRPEDKTNPTLAGGVYNDYITAGLGFWWGFTGSRVKFVIAISDGGRYGMDSTAIKVSYKGGYISSGDIKFHPGTYSKQIVPYTVTAISTGGDTFTAPGLGVANNDPVRFHVRGGAFPGGITDNKLWVYNKSGDTYSLSSTDPATLTTAVDITSLGTGTLKVWKADAGWDDPIQGMPSICPETKTSFSGICYIEGYLPSSYNTNTEPTWDDFRIEGKGRKLMNYDSVGAPTVVVDGTSGLLGNPALVAADVAFVEYKRPTSRFDWTSWNLLKAAAPVLIWQRSDTEQQGRGLKAEYGVHSGSPTYTNPLYVKRDAVIDFPSSSAAPFEGIPATNFWGLWTGKIKFKYAETYTFTAVHDDSFKLVIGATTVINQPAAGTHTGTFTATAGQVATIRVEFSQATGPWYCTMKWSSASLPIEVVPVNSLYEPDEQVPSIDICTAFSNPTETSYVFEHVIGKCPGWDWTDKDGKIIFLPPNRTQQQYLFVYDAEDDDVFSTIVDKSFEKNRRHRRERRNFALYSYRRKTYTGYPEEFVEQDRPLLRERGNGMPNNDPPAELMVMNRAQAKAISDIDFAMTTDPVYDLTIGGRRGSGVVGKNEYVRVKNFVKGDRRIDDSVCHVFTVDRQGKDISFTLLPLVFPLFTVELV